LEEQKIGAALFSKVGELLLAQGTKLSRKISRDQCFGSA